jgi:hypothetical protein
MNAVVKDFYLRDRTTSLKGANRLYLDSIPNNKILIRKSVISSFTIRYYYSNTGLYRTNDGLSMVCKIIL